MIACTPTRPRARLVAVTGLVSVSLLLSGCLAPTVETSASSSSTPSASASPIVAADANAPVTLTWWTGQTTDAETNLEALAADFTKLHPQVTIKTSSGASTTDELLTKLSSSFAAGTYPDISYAYGSWASELAASGRALDITANVSAPDVKWAEFPQAARFTASPGGKTIGFPAVVDNLALFYNKTVFDKAGVAYPTDDWTWDDFRAAAKKISDPKNNIYGTAMPVNGSEDTTWRMWPQLWQQGGDVLTADAKNVSFNSPAGVATVKFWQDMAQTDKSVYLDQTGQKFAPLFDSDNIGLLVSGPWQLYELSDAGTKYGVVRLPGTNGDHQTVSGPDIWTLFDHQDANRAYWSYTFMEWLTHPEQDARWNLALGNLPLRSSALTTTEYKDTVAKYPGFDVLANNLANAKKMRPTVTGYVEVSDIYGKAVSGLVQGNGDVKAALDTAATKADDALRSR